MIYPPTEDTLELAARLIKEGGLVAFPTETVYGLGADATNSAAIKKIFEVKRRPHYNPLIVHISSYESIGDVVDFSGNPKLKIRAEKLSTFWPGPLSLVLPKLPCISDLVTGGLDTVAVRVPSHPVARKLISTAGRPIAAPSANLFTTVSPTTAQHVEEAFGEQIEIIIDGGPCQVGIESTVVSLTGKDIEVLRPGGITLEQLGEAFKDTENVLLKAGGSSEAIKAALSPGMMKVHYAPHTPLAFIGSIQHNNIPKRTGLISFRADCSTQSAFSKTLCLSQAGDLNEVAARLFSALREMDQLGLDLILIDTCEEKGIGLAIMDRLKRAAAASDSENS